jgi:DNA-binding CsgD family transcriptional regulator
VELLERAGELAVLTEAVRAARNGNGRFVAFEAQPGLGKTELLTEAGRLFAGAGLTVATARGSPLEQEFAFGVVCQLFDHVLADAGDARARLLAGAAGKCAALLDPATVPAGPESQGLFGLLHGLYWLTVNLADRGPVAIIVDDAHWSDPQSLEFLGFLVRRIDALPVVVVLATRPGGSTGRDARLGGLLLEPGARVLAPRPLSSEAVTQLVRATLGQTAHQAFCLACHEVTRGNPLFIRELLRALAADGVAPAAAAVPAVRSAGPGAVARYVRLRVGLLSADARGFAEAVAVLGEAADSTVAAQLADCDDQAAAEISGRLTAQGIFAGGPSPTFAHPLVREAVYQSMSLAARQRAHDRAARVLLAAGAAPERVASHVLQTAPAGDVQRVEILLLAARAARDRGLPEGAVAYLTRAWAEPPPPQWRSEVSRVLGSCEVYCLMFADAERHLREALQLADTPAQLALSAFSLARFLNACGEPAQAIDVLLTAHTELPGGADPQLAVRIEAELIGFARVSTPHQALLSGRLSAFAAGQEVGSALWPPYRDVLAAHQAVEEALSDGGDMGTARGLAERALASGRLSPDLSALYVAVNALLACGELDSAERYLEQGLATATNRGLRVVVALARGYLSKVALFRGDLADAQAHVDAGIEAAPGLHFALPLLRSSRIEYLLEQGDLGGAGQTLKECDLPGDDSMPQSILYLWLLYARGRLRLAAGAHQAALDDFLECGRRYRECGPCLLDLPWRSRAAEAFTQLGQPEQAAGLVDRELELARSFGAARSIGIALTSAARLADGEAALRLAQDAVSVLESSPARLELARAQEVLGMALTRLGRRGPGRQAFRRALQLALECHAGALAERTREQLTAGGGRPPRLWLTGVHSLTPAERRVAQLVARELTNRQVAETLFVTEKTVEAHLNRVYRKLQVSSRWQLKAKLDEQAAGEEPA